ncbi:MAG: bifunctional 4-hydroxy-2-oxoglutarate aldolase/2-dehydro-3-deoxy-phosphogluconate aldolase [Candidatus Brocadiaceae bacterium]|nr:bifunctional 4-hydroxy-2-oxoglutarate aldolase/2-dehydro-3-deoxy-phosphogluconate aldolase [Candidatus Brocadiaceae bacterium]
MADYRRDRKRVDAALRKSGIVVVMNKSHIETPEHMVTTMRAVYEAGYVAEVTFRIDEGLLREAMQDLVKLRAESPAENPFVLGVGSVINPRELAAAIEMGFDMIVAPANVMGGCGEGCEFVRIAHEADCFVSPAVFTPTEFNYFLEREDGLEPDAFKIFPARSHGPKGVSDLLAPFARPRHKGRIIMPTGAVDYETGPQYVDVIGKRGFTPVLGMSAPLALVVDRKAPGDTAVIAESLKTFEERFRRGHSG